MNLGLPCRIRPEDVRLSLWGVAPFFGSRRRRAGLLLEDSADEGALACLQYMRIPQRDPEALQPCGRLLTVVEFLARPPPLSGLVDVKVEHVPVLDLVAIGGDVVDGLSELARDAELAQALLAWTLTGVAPYRGDVQSWHHRGALGRHQTQAPRARRMD
jgi:hypothetical protein